MYDLVDNLRDLRDIAGTMGAEDLGREIAAGLEGLEAHTFRLAVVGEFKRGKSTFINALLGSPVLPADILPTSATLNRITYGLTPSARLHFHDTDDVEEIPVDALADHVTKLTPEAEERSRRISEAVVSYPVPFCRNNIDLYDTPGLADEARMTAITMEILPRVDAVILVVMGDSPFSNTEADFLDTLFDRGLRRVIVVVTGMDRVRREADKQRLVSSIGDRVRGRIGTYAAARFGEDTDDYVAFMSENGRPAMFAVSGLDALEAKLEADDEALERSGFPKLEAYLERFLTEQADSLSLRRRLAGVRVWCDRLDAALAQRELGLPGELEGLKSRHYELIALMDVVDAMVTRELSVLESGARSLVYGPLEALLTSKYPADIRLSLQRGVRSITITTKQLMELDILRGRVGDALEQAQEYAVRFHAPTILEVCMPAVDGQRQALAPIAVTADRIMGHVRRASSAPARERAEALSLCQALGCQSYSTDLIWAGSGAALGGAQEPDAARLDELIKLLTYDRAQLVVGQDSPAVNATAAPPPANSFLARTSWDMTAPSAYKKAATSAAVGAADTFLRMDPLGERVLRFIHSLQCETRDALERFLDETRRERVQFSMQEQRQQVLLERSLGDLDRMKMRVRAVRDHAEGVERELARA